MYLCTVAWNETDFYVWFYSFSTSQLVHTLNRHEEHQLTLPSSRMDNSALCVPLFYYFSTVLSEYGISGTYFLFKILIRVRVQYVRSHWCCTRCRAWYITTISVLYLAFPVFSLFFSLHFSSQEPNSGEQNPRNVGDPGGATEQDWGRPGQYQCRDEAGRETPHWHGEVVWPLCLPLEQVKLVSVARYKKNDLIWKGLCLKRIYCG